MGDAFTLLHAHDAWVEARGTGEDGRRWCRLALTSPLALAPNPDQGAAATALTLTINPDH